VAIAFGETFEALVAGVQGALWALGGVPAVLRSDNLSTKKAIYVMIERRQLPGVTRLGKRILIRTEHLLDWLHQQCASSLQE
jgi:hypothetical protein